MKKVVIYGLGKAFDNDFFLYEQLPKLREKYDVICGCDKIYKNIEKYGIDYIERGEHLNKYDKIIVTSNRYYREIRTDLIVNFGIDLKKIVSIENEWATILGECFNAEFFIKKNGVEIGGPSDIFDAIYRKVETCDGVNFQSSTEWWIDSGKGYKYKDKYLGKVIIEDAVNMSSIKGEQYDFCISSNNLEHIANPLKAIQEFKRIVKKNGLILIVVPKKESNFDHRRSVTKMEHIIDDYLNDISEEDLTHLDEIMKLHDFDMDIGVSSSENFYDRAIKNYDNRCLHQHVFDEQLLIEIFKYMDINIIKSGALYYNYYILGEK